LAEPDGKGRRRVQTIFGDVLYLWMVCGLFVLDQEVILVKQTISYSAQGFTVVNALTPDLTHETGRYHA
jgi:hypothetical protein